MCAVFSLCMQGYTGRDAEPDFRPNAAAWSLSFRLWEADSFDSAAPDKR